MGFGTEVLKDNSAALAIEPQPSRTQGLMASTCPDWPGDAENWDMGPNGPFLRQGQQEPRGHFLPPALCPA